MVLQKKGNVYQTGHYSWYDVNKLMKYLDDVPDLVAVVAGRLVPVLSAVTRNVPGPCNVSCGVAAVVWSWIRWIRKQICLRDPAP
jgi:hypothetical protein